MLHLDPERLAALADEAPTAEEGAHLATCLACRRERDAFVSLLVLAQREGAAAFDLDAADAPPLTSWPALSDALRADGLLASPAGAAVAEGGPKVIPLPVRRPSAVAPLLRRVAAAALFVTGGMALGRASVGAPALPIGDAALGDAPAVAAVDPSEPAGTALLTAGASSFESVEHASRVLAAAQRDYQRAAAFLAEHDSSATLGSPEALQARLAALDEVMPRVREALSVAPADPVLNQVYLTTYDVRESTLRQLGRTLPVGARVNGY